MMLGYLQIWSILYFIFLFSDFQEMAGHIFVFVFDNPIQRQMRFSSCPSN